MMDEGSAGGAIDLSSHSSETRQREAARYDDHLNTACYHTHKHTQSHIKRSFKSFKWPLISSRLRRHGPWLTIFIVCWVRLHPPFAEVFLLIYLQSGIHLFNIQSNTLQLAQPCLSDRLLLRLFCSAISTQDVRGACSCSCEHDEPCLCNHEDGECVFTCWCVITLAHVQIGFCVAAKSPCSIQPIEQQIKAAKQCSCSLRSRLYCLFYFAHQGFMINGNKLDKHCCGGHMSVMTEHKLRWTLCTL